MTTDFIPITTGIPFSIFNQIFLGVKFMDKKGTNNHQSLINEELKYLSDEPCYFTKSTVPYILQSFLQKQKFYYSGCDQTRSMFMAEAYLRLQWRKSAQVLFF